MSQAAKEFAARLNGREYRKELTNEEDAEAKAAGLVVVYGASDDLMELGGAINDEIGCSDGGTVYLTPDGLLANDCKDYECPHFIRAKESAATIEAVWCKEPGYSWTYRTEIPHHTFEIVEDGEPYCRGIVFALSSVPSPAAPASLESGLVGVTMEPLSDEQIIAARQALTFQYGGLYADTIAFARAIEKAHGIAARAESGEPT